MPGSSFFPFIAKRGVCGPSEPSTDEQGDSHYAKRNLENGGPGEQHGAVIGNAQVLKGLAAITPQ